MEMFHSSLEGAQHGKKSLIDLIKFAKGAGFAGVQPSNFHIQKKDGSFMTANEVQSAFARRKMKLDGISGHCPFWVHTTAWTGSKTIRPFVPTHLRSESVETIEAWAESYILALLDLCADLKIKVVPMFWGVAFGWELASGYPWGFFSGEDYDLLQEGKERFVTKTAKIRSHAKSLGISLAHEIHPATAASCANDFLMLREICDSDTCLGVNADPSHCWEGESWENRFTKVGEFITGCHAKDHIVRPGLPLRSMEPNWQKRGMQFTKLGDGGIDLIAYSQLLAQVGYVKRYCALNNTATAPLVAEAESAVYNLDLVSGNAAGFINDRLCLEYASTTFEEGMGA